MGSQIRPSSAAHRPEQGQQTFRVSAAKRQLRSYPETHQFLSGDQALVPGGEFTTFDWVPEP
jgi:hypothetical protein